MWSEGGLSIHPTNAPPTRASLCMLGDLRKQGCSSGSLGRTLILLSPILKRVELRSSGATPGDQDSASPVTEYAPVSGTLEASP